MRSEVEAEPALEPRSLNSQTDFFLTPEPQWVAVGFRVSKTRLSPPGARHGFRGSLELVRDCPIDRTHLTPAP